ncbi:MAG: CBS domain-containing protein [Armatimonadetes bacterium]|nr:CBS domain-containing protein [Armatimonadota bacterium]
MSSPAVTIDAGATVAEALDTMRDHGISSLVVRPDAPGRDHGIVTKRDILTKVVVRDLDPEGLLVRDIMNAPLITIRAHWGLEETSALMAAAGIRRVAVVRGDEILGVVSDTDIFTALEAQDWSAARAARKARVARQVASGAEARTVADLMSSPVLTISPDATVRDCIRRMLDHGVSSLLVEAGPSPNFGIITKRDIITKVIARGKDRGAVLVQEVMSIPLRTVPHDAGIQECSARMARERMRRLPVVREEEIVGIISDSDIFAAAEARRWRGRRRRPTLHTVADVMQTPATGVRSDQTVADALALMKERHIESLLVRPQEAGRPWGLLTRQEIVSRVLARHQDPRTVPVHTVMRSPVVTVSPETSLWECSARMASSGAPVLPVVQGGEVIGTVSDADIFTAIEERGWGVD